MGFLGDRGGGGKDGLDGDFLKISGRKKRIYRASDWGHFEEKEHWGRKQPTVI